MASALPPVKGAAFSFEIGLTSQADTNIFKTSVTIAAADVLVSKDGGATAQIASVPTEIGTSGLLTVVLSATEMNADRVTVLFHDASGAEWQDAVVTIYTAAQTLDTTDGVADDVKSDTAAILVDTGTDGVQIAADAITSAAFDESTAFPLKAADTGSTYIARTGADSDTLETLSDQLDTLTTYSAGAGSITFTYTLTDSSDSTPIPDATVEVFSDSTLSTLVAMGTTDSSGEVVFYLDAGTYYLQARKAGYSFSTDTEVVA